MKEYQLKVASDGIAVGPAFFLETKPSQRAGSPGALDVRGEINRFDSAVASLEQALTLAAAKAGKENAAIFEAEGLLLKDQRFLRGIRDLIRDSGVGAAAAARRTGKRLAEELRKSSSAYIRERSDDILGLAEKLADILEGGSGSALRIPSILAATELGPAQLSTLNPWMILGIVTEKGSPSSHVSILARNLGIPFCYGSHEAIEAVRKSRCLILDKGRLILDPDERTLRAAELEMEKRKEEKEREKKAVKAGISRTKVYANIAGTAELKALLDSGAEGVGLFRTEFLFLGEEAAPSEEEQFRAYKAITEAMGQKETVIRTMDLGADKRADWLALPEEKNPALGLRGLRLSLLWKDLFRVQLRALLRAAVYGEMLIMVPMVASVREVDAVREQIQECAEELSREGIPCKVPPLGIMVETPAAVMLADQLAEKVDFFSIGTNDLTQYTLAQDRESPGPDDYFDPGYEAVLRMIRMTAQAGHKHGIPTAVCGELASSPEAIKKLIESGVDELSVSISKVSATKARVIEAESLLFK